LIELIIDFLISRAIDVQMFFHYFLLYFCVYLLHEDSEVGQLALYHSIVLLVVQVIGSDPNYFFHEAVLHEILLIQITLLTISGRRAHILISLNTISIVLNVLMYEFQTEVLFLFDNYININRILLETTIGVLIYDHKSKRRNLILILIMTLIYAHEIKYL